MKKILKKIVLGIACILAAWAILIYLTMPHEMTVNEYRKMLDTTLYTHPRTSNDSAMINIIMKTEFYSKYRKTNDKDSLTFYLRQAEKEATRILNRKE